MNKLRIIILCIAIFAFSSMYAQQKNSTGRENYFSFDISTGASYKLYMLYDRYSAYPATNLNPIKARMLYCGKKINFVLGFDMQQVKDNSSHSYLPSTIIFNQIKFGIDYFPIIRDKYNIGLNISYGSYFTNLGSEKIGDRGTSNEIGLIGLYKLSEQFHIFLNPYFGLNYSTQYSEEFIVTSKLFSLNVGVKFNPIFENKNNVQQVDSPKRFNLGFQFGFNVLTLQKEDYIYNNEDPYYKNAFYFRKSAYPIIGIVHKTKNNNIHSLGFGYRNYSGSEPNRIGEEDMYVSTTDLTSFYKFDYSICKNHSKKTSFFAPYIGIQATWNNKVFSILDNPSTDTEGRTFDLKVKSNSNLMLLQLSPSLKYFYNNVYCDLSLNLNLTGLAIGNYDYVNIHIDNRTSYTTSVKENYKEFLLPSKFVKDKFFIYDFSLKLGYIF